MRKVIGIGETILDIIFKDNQPTHAIPGGSVFNTMISLSRLGIECCFISEFGRDRVGEVIRAYMVENGLKTDHIDLFGENSKSPVSLAFLDNEYNPQYLFYTDYPSNRLDVVWPGINEDDILIFGSYYSLNPALRERILEFLQYARDRKALIYYDPNFRKPHAHEALRLMPSVIENMEFADLVRGSLEDFGNLYHLNDPATIYKEKIKFYSNNFICTSGHSGADIFTPGGTAHYEALPVDVVSTIGAGDNFNAGILYGIIKYGISRSELSGLTLAEWDKIIKCGLEFSADACASYENTISKNFATGRPL